MIGQLQIMPRHDIICFRKSIRFWGGEHGFFVIKYDEIENHINKNTYKCMAR